MAGGNTRYEPLDVDDGVHVRAPPPQRSVFLSPRTRADWAFVGGNIGLFLVSLLLWAAGGRGRLSEWECAKVVSPYCECAHPSLCRPSRLQSYDWSVEDGQNDNAD